MSSTRSDDEVVKPELPARSEGTCVQRWLTAGLTAATLCGCATVSQKPVAVESPVPRTEQVAAQESLKTPMTVRHKRKIAIGRFTNETNYGRTLLTDEEYDRVGKQASDMLTSRLVMSGAFVVLERPDLKKITREQSLAGGSLVGADTLIMGSITEFGRSVSGKSGFLSGTKVQLARAKVDIRLVDVKTGHAYFSALGTGEANTESGQIAGFGSHAAYDATLNDRAIAAAISDVIDRLVSKLRDRPWRTDILEIEEERVFISGGKSQGIKPGDSLVVMQAGSTIRSSQSGFDVELPPTRVATLRVKSLFGESETSEGSICEITSGEIDRTRLKRLFVAESTKE